MKKQEKQRYQFNQYKRWLPLWLDRCLQHHLNFPSTSALFQSECMDFRAQTCIEHNQILLSFHRYSCLMVVKQIIDSNPKSQNIYIKNTALIILFYDEESIQIKQVVRPIQLFQKGIDEKKYLKVTLLKVQRVSKQDQHPL
ncbi:unnamed protein product [Paramecium octaurelia]|uniref:Uncharacterized protein n=1 Tax=Paramecium octaurelia TaxID=43137 RepID=A0A8S1WA20_PAROT|nr:unnamed protein product [Paramecium octaurelia]